MRFELAGSFIRPDPLILVYPADATFDTAARVELGFTHFEVICIGAGGGSGGGINTENTGTLIRSYGGAGGGGGFHRVRGLLSALQDDCPIVVGSPGASGVDHASNPALTTDGADGEASSFNTTTCRASGGKGGDRVQSNSDTVSTLAHGGEGGLGNRVIAGGGAEGGLAGIPSPAGPGTLGTPGADGTLFNNIGKGGGGGAGGVRKWNGVICNPATAGGRGSYNPGDTSVYGPGDIPTDAVIGIDPGPIVYRIVIPGNGGGAKATPLNGLPTVYGKTGSPGVVIVRLTADVHITAPPAVTPGGDTAFGNLLLPIIFTKSVSGAKRTYSGPIARPITFGKSVNGTASTPKITPVAELSLASHVAPVDRSTHSIKIRARTTTGSGGVIKAAIFQGVINRSGDLVSPPLTNVLTEYELDIPTMSAAEITDYSNLSIKIWGYVQGGAALVFEVSNVYLELPSA